MDARPTGHRSGMLGLVGANGVETQLAGILIPSQDIVPSTRHIMPQFETIRASMNRIQETSFYPNRFVDMHADAGIGLACLYAPALGPLNKQLPFTGAPKNVTFSEGMDITYVSIPLNPVSLAYCHVAIPMCKGDLIDSMVPDTMDDVQQGDHIYNQALISTNISRLNRIAGIAAQYAPELPITETFLSTALAINAILKKELTADYQTFLLDRGLELGVTLGQLLFWIIHKRTSNKPCEYRIVLAFLTILSKKDVTIDGGYIRDLISQFRMWVEGACSSCFLHSFLALTPRNQKVPFLTTSVMDGSDKFYYITPHDFHAVASPHDEQLTTTPQYWVSIPMFEHTQIFYSAMMGTSLLNSNRLSFSATIPNYVVTSFDYIATRLVRCVRAAKAGRLFPLADFFRFLTNDFVTMETIKYQIIICKHVANYVPVMKELCSGMITILLFGALPAGLTDKPWRADRDSNREEILQDIANAQRINYLPLKNIISANHDGFAYLSILFEPVYSNFYLTTLRDEYNNLITRDNNRT